MKPLNTRLVTRRQFLYFSTLTAAGRIGGAAHDPARGGQAREI